MVLQGGGKDGNDDRRAMARPCHHTETFNYYSNKNAHIKSTEYSIGRSCNGFDQGNGEGLRFADPDRLAQISIVVHTDSSGSQYKVGEVRKYGSGGGFQGVGNSTRTGQGSPQATRDTVATRLEGQSFRAASQSRAK